MKMFLQDVSSPADSRDPFKLERMSGHFAGEFPTPDSRAFPGVSRLEALRLERIPEVDNLFAERGS